MSVGCSKKADNTPPAPSPAAETKPADPPVTSLADEPVAPGSTASGINLSMLGDKLRFEKEHRGAGPSADKIFEALTKAGYPPVGRRQVLGSTAGANYCEGAEVVNVSVVVCEYASEKDATDAKAAIEKKWAQLSPTLDRIVHGAATITVIHGGNKTADVPKIFAAASAA